MYFPDAATVARIMLGDAVNAIIALPLAYEHGVLAFFEDQGEDAADVPNACALMGMTLQRQIKRVWGREAWPNISRVAPGYENHRWVLEEVEVRAAMRKDLDDEFDDYFGGNE